MLLSIYILANSETQATLHAEGEQGRADQCAAAAEAFQEIGQLLAEPSSTSGEVG